MRLIPAFGCALLAAIALGCASQDDEAGEAPQEDASGDAGKTLEEMREEAWAKIDVEACEEKGGVVRPEGMLGLPRCVIPYPDAGEICSDASDCEGRCFANDDVTDYEGAPGEMNGVCEADDSPFGCFAEINNGELAGMLCVD